MTYRYLGDRFTDYRLNGQLCTSVCRPDGKSIRGKNGSMLVSFEGKKVIVVARLLRKVADQKRTELTDREKALAKLIARLLVKKAMSDGGLHCEDIVRLAEK